MTVKDLADQLNQTEQMRLKARRWLIRSLVLVTGLCLVMIGGSGLWIQRQVSRDRTILHQLPQLEADMKVAQRALATVPSFIKTPQGDYIRIVPQSSNRLLKANHQPMDGMYAKVWYAKAHGKEA